MHKATEKDECKGFLKPEDANYPKSKQILKCGPTPANFGVEGIAFFLVFPPRS